MADPEKRGRGRPRLDATCGRGHPRTTKNTYVQPDGKRICRLCRAGTKMRYVANKRKREGKPPPDDRRRNVCRKGHPRTTQNTYVRPQYGSVECKVCRDAAHRRYRQKNSSSPTPPSQGGFTCKETTNVNDLHH